MTKNIEVVKAPNDTKKQSVSRDFQSMPQLYLELLENKDKIKPNIVNKDYIPDDRSDISEALSLKQFPNKSAFRGGSKLAPTYEDEEEEEEEEEEEDDDEEEEEEEDDDDEEEEEDDDDEEEEEEDEEDDDEEEDIPRRSTMPPPRNSQITSKLYDILSEQKPSMEGFENMNGGGGGGGGYGDNVPKLSDLEQSGQIRRDKMIPDFTFNHDTLSSEEQDDLKRDILFKFELLKKSYKNIPIDIPEYTMHSDYNSMKRSYDNTVRRVSLDSTVESYKTYLIGGFMVMEFILGHWLKFDMQGFTQQQILNMSTYDKLLIELGEKNYVPEGSEWPVELRLLFMIIINAGVFIVSKLIMKKTGTNFMSMMNSMNEFQKSTNNMSGGANGGANKRKMRGPNIDVTDLPDL